MAGPPDARKGRHRWEGVRHHLRRRLRRDPDPKAVFQIRKDEEPADRHWDGLCLGFGWDVEEVFLEYRTGREGRQANDEVVPRRGLPPPP